MANSYGFVRLIALVFLLVSVVLLKTTQGAIIWIPLAAAGHFIFLASAEETQIFLHKKNARFRFTIKISLIKFCVLMFGFAMYLAVTFPVDSAFLVTFAHSFFGEKYWLGWFILGFLYISPVAIFLRGSAMTKDDGGISSNKVSDKLIKVKCSECDVRSEISEFGSSIEKKTNPKWFQLSHKYIQYKCPNCNRGGKIRLKGYGTWTLGGVLILVPLILPMIFEGAAYLIYLVAPGLLLLWIRRDNLVVFVPSKRTSHYSYKGNEN